MVNINKILTHINQLDDIDSGIFHTLFSQFNIFFFCHSTERGRHIAVIFIYTPNPSSRVSIFIKEREQGHGEAVEKGWHALVAEYRKRNLTRDADKLPDLASEIAKNTGDK